jgi:hypothetical protein
VFGAKQVEANPDVPALYRGNGADEKAETGALLDMEKGTEGSPVEEVLGEERDAETGAIGGDAKDSDYERLVAEAAASILPPAADTVYPELPIVEYTSVCEYRFELGATFSVEDLKDALLLPGDLLLACRKLLSIIPEVARLLPRSDSSLQWYLIVGGKSRSLESLLSARKLAILRLEKFVSGRSTTKVGRISPIVSLAFAPTLALSFAFPLALAVSLATALHRSLALSRFEQLFIVLQAPGHVIVVTGMRVPIVFTRMRRKVRLRRRILFILSLVGNKLRPCSGRGFLWVR